MTKIFISRSSKENEFALKLAQRLIEDPIGSTRCRNI